MTSSVKIDIVSPARCNCARIRRTAGTFRRFYDTLLGAERRNRISFMANWRMLARIVSSRKLTPPGKRTGKAASNTWHGLRTYPFFLACFFRPQLWMALGPMVVSVFALKGALA